MYERKPLALVLLNPPEEDRKYEIPKTTNESSILGQEKWWQPFKSEPNNQRGWVQIDAGRQVSLMGWKVEAQGGTLQPNTEVYTLSVSNDGEAWLNPNVPTCYHRYSVYRGGTCHAHARYFRLTPAATIKQDDRKIRFGLIILDDGGEHIIGPRRVRDLSPLHVAAKMGDTEMMAKLLDHGADLEMLAGIWKPTAEGDFSRGTTALELAAASSSLAAVQILVDRGAKVDEHTFQVPKGKAGDLVAGYLQTNGSKPVTRTT